jgi:hypothetical protein
MLAQACILKKRPGRVVSPFSGTAAHVGEFANFFNRRVWIIRLLILADLLQTRGRPENLGVTLDLPPSCLPTSKILLISPLDLV